MKLRSVRRGASAIEFALIFPIVFLIIMASAEYSWVLFRHQLILDALVTSARAGAVVLLDEATYIALDGYGQPVLPDSNNPSSEAAAIEANTRLADLVGCGTCASAELISDPSGETTAYYVHVEATVPYTSLTNLVTVPTSLTYHQDVPLEDWF